MTNNPYLGIDISMNLKTNDIEFSTKNDFKLKANNPNLEQAIMNRLKTFLGEMKTHPQYGSRLNSVVGSIGNDGMLNEITQIVRACLLQEPRIQNDGIIKIDPEFRSGYNNQVVDIEISVMPINSQVPLNMVYPYIIEEEA